MRSQIRLHILIFSFFGAIACRAKIDDPSLLHADHALDQPRGKINSLGCFGPFHDRDPLQHLCLVYYEPGGEIYLDILQSDSGGDSVQFEVYGQFNGKVVARSPVTLQKTGDRHSLDSRILSQGIHIGTYHDFAPNPIIVELCDLSGYFPTKPGQIKKACRVTTKSEIQSFQPDATHRLPSAIRLLGD
jgi:hypothetical protein